MTVLKRMLSMPRARIAVDGAEDPLGESGNAARGVVPPVEVVERDAELVDPGVAQRRGALGGEHRRRA